jgi:predicted transcriptional regulator
LQPRCLGYATKLQKLIVHRDIKNVSIDVKHLSQIDLVELTEKDNLLLPLVDYEKIELDIAV